MRDMIGAYRIQEKLGEGGMGEVYRATDTKLGRAVAIKVLPASVAQNPERLARFDREARTLASLNHPNVAAIHGLEDADGTKALVMELVEGPTLADRLAQGAIPWDEALPIARQIAEALAAAHEQGIVHRDLKPANIKVRPDGTVKVLDFGLAKALEPAAAMSPALSQSPTITTPARLRQGYGEAGTEMGTLLGTAAYMSPEQARGKPVDRRADIWAFGCVLFEMLAGHRAFDGDNTVDVLGAVTRAEPDWAALPPDLPQSVRTLLQTCLVKDARRRVGEVATVLFVLDHVESLAATDRVNADLDGAVARAGGEIETRWRRRAVWMTGAALALGAAAAGIGAWMARPAAPVRSLSVTLPGDMRLAGRGIAFSPDGQALAIPVDTGLVLRRLDRPELTLLPGTEGATFPFFSPDGTWVGFGAGDALRKVRADGSTPATTIVRGLNTLSGRPWWGEDDTILFGVIADGLSRVPAGGGTPEPITVPHRDAGEVLHAEPQVLPGGATVLLSVAYDTGGAPAIMDLDTRRWRVLSQARGWAAQYVPSGHLLLLDGDTLVAAGFDPDAGEVLGSPVPVGTGVGTSFAVSSEGALAWRSSGGDQSPLMARGRIVRADRMGNVTAVEPDASVWVEGAGGMALSPDGQRLVVPIMSSDDTSSAHIYVYDLARRTRTRLTDRQGIHAWPRFSTDGARLAFLSTRDPMGIYTQPAEPGSSAEVVLRRRDMMQFPLSWAPDGAIVFNEINPKTGMDVGVLSPDGTSAMLLSTAASETRAVVSPNGEWLAYQSAPADSQQYDVYVRPFRGSGSPVIVSSGGGAQPRWAGDRELIYRRGPQVVSVQVVPGPEKFIVGTERVLFEADDYPTHYDVSSDGRTFLMLRRETASTDLAFREVRIVERWFNELRRLVPR